MRVASTHCHTLLPDVGHTGRNLPEGRRQAEPGQEDTCPKTQSPGKETGCGVTPSRPKASRGRQTRSSFPVSDGDDCQPTQRLGTLKGGKYTLSHLPSRLGSHWQKRPRRWKGGRAWPRGYLPQTPESGSRDRLWRDALPAEGV